MKVLKMTGIRLKYYGRIRTQEKEGKQWMGLKSKRSLRKVENWTKVGKYIRWQEEKSNS